MRRKPDNTTVVRLELQDTERAMLESYLMTWQVGKAATSIDQLISFENVYFGATLFEMITGKEILFGTPNDIIEIIDGFRQWWAQRSEEEETWWQQGIEIWAEYFTLPGVISQL